MMKKKVKIFDIVLIVIFTVFSLVMIIPVYINFYQSDDAQTIPDFLLHNGYGNDHGIADLSTWGVCADSVEDAGAGIYCQCAVVYHDI